MLNQKVSPSKKKTCSSLSSLAEPALIWDICRVFLAKDLFSHNKDSRQSTVSFPVGHNSLTSILLIPDPCGQPL